MSDSSTRIAVVGLGYVGLPAAVAFSRKFPELFGRSPTRFRAESGASPEGAPG